MKNLFLLAVIALFFSCSKTSSPTPVSTAPVQVTESILIANSWFDIRNATNILVKFYKNGVIVCQGSNYTNYSIDTGTLAFNGNGWSYVYTNCTLKQDTILGYDKLNQHRSILIKAN